MRIFLVNLQGPGCIVNDEGEFVNQLIHELAKFIEDEITLLCLGVGDLPDGDSIKMKVQRKRISISVARFITEDSRSIKDPFEGTAEEQLKRVQEFNDQVVKFLDLQKGLVHVLGSGLVLNIAKQFHEFRSEVEHHDPRPVITSIMSLESVDSNVKSEVEEGVLQNAEAIIINDLKLKDQLEKIYPEVFQGEKIKYIPPPKDDWTHVVSQYREVYRSFS